ncbi:MAG: phospholipid carrier-dependent glycosyltransferase [Deferribacteres bacterium]|nr:phospholipid carrier-dependent glycosyltransferase [Deferribacteres bacterium]
MESIPEWKKDVASFYMHRRSRVMEPRLIEYMASFAYRMAGGEYLWIPRLMSSIFWLIGAVFLYLTAERITFSGAAALFSTAFYLFLPISILGSRSILAEPLMIMMLLVGLFTILRYYERPSVFRLAATAGVSALAIFIKPMCMFLLFGAFVALSVNRHGVWKTVISRRLLVFTVLSLLPVTAYFFLTGFFRDELLEQSQISFIPQLLLSPSFWKDWLAMVGSVVGYIALTAALAGILRFRQGIPRAMITGLWIGYFVFGLSFNNRITVHDYYHLQLIPVVALSLGPIGADAIRHITDYVRAQRWRISALAILLLVLSGAGIFTISRLQWREATPDLRNKMEIMGSIFGINPQFIKFVKPDFTEEVETAREIGEIVGHTTKVITLSSNYGELLAYYGELTAYPWQTSLTFQIYKMQGINVPPIDELFNTFYKRWGFPSYFIITDFRELDRQPELKNFLDKNFPVMIRNNNYLIYDLREKTALSFTMAKNILAGAGDTGTQAQ